jgi:hypothetical protein
MNAATRMALLAAALVPYAALAGVDAWMHERERRVPRLEQVLHAVAALLFVGFIVAVFKAATNTALVLFAAFAVCAACDEFGFHRQLAARERWIHFAAYSALVVFVGAWRFIESGT